MTEPMKGVVPRNWHGKAASSKLKRHEEEILRSLYGPSDAQGFYTGTEVRDGDS